MTRISPSPFRSGRCAHAPFGRTETAIERVLDAALAEVADPGVDGDILRELVEQSDLGQVREALVVAAVRCLPQARAMTAAEMAGDVGTGQDSITPALARTA